MVKKFAGLLISALLLWLTLSKIQTGTPLLLPTLHQLPFILISILLSLFGFAIQAIRWSFFFEVSGQSRLSKFLPSTLMGHFFNSILPFRMGEFIRPMHLAAKHKMNFLEVLPTCVADKFLDLVFIGFFAGLLMYKSIVEELQHFTFITSAQNIVFACLTAFIVLALCIWFYSKIFTDAPLLKTISTNIKNSLSALKPVRIKDSFGAIALLTVFLWLIILLGNYLLLYATGLPIQLISVKTGLYLTVFTTFAYAIPAAPSSIGTLNFAVVAALEYLLHLQHQVITPELQNTIIVASGIFYVASVLPDLISGAFLLFFERQFVAEIIRNKKLTANAPKSGI